MTTWVVVASSARARFFAVTNRGGDAVEVADLVNPENRVSDRDIGTDKPGRSFDSHGQHRHALEKSVEPKDEVKRRFAKEVVAYATEGLRKQRFARMCVVAEPQFLGLLREQMGAELAHTVEEEVAKDLTRNDFATVRQQLTYLH